MTAENGTGVEIRSIERQLGNRMALQGVSMSLPRGETLALFGPNGAGKTTLIRIVATLSHANAGQVSVLGMPLPDQATSVRAKIGLVAHEPLLYRQLSSRENLRFYARLYGVANREARIEKLLDSVEMLARGNDPVRSLSRGMVQRIAVCRAVLHEPEVLLLDEPFAHLDAAAMSLAEPLLGRATGRTRLLVAHDLEHGLREADRVLGLRDGKPVVSGAASEFSVADLRASLFGKKA